MKEKELWERIFFRIWKMDSLVCIRQTEPSREIFERVMRIVRGIKRK